VSGVSKIGTKPLAIVAAVVLLAATFFVFQGGGSDTRTVSAYFDRTVSIYKGSELRVMGVRIGTVTAVVPEGDRVRVAMEYDSEYKLPADAKAAIITPTLTADRFVQVAPAYTGGAVLPDKAKIALPKTGTPVELDRIYQSLSDLTTALGPNGANKNGALDDLLGAGTKALEGNGQVRPIVIRIPKGIRTGVRLERIVRQRRLDVLERDDAVEAQLGTGLRRERGNRHRVVENIMKPAQHRRTRNDVKLRRDDPQVVAFARAEHHAMFAKRHLLGIAIDCGVTDADVPHPVSGHPRCRHGHPWISSVQTLKPASVFGPKVLVIATSVASRPRAMRTRPMRGTLFRASKVCHCPSRYTSNQAAKSIGPWGGGTPISPRYPVQ